MTDKTEENVFEAKAREILMRILPRLTGVYRRKDGKEINVPIISNVAAEDRLVSAIASALEAERLEERREIMTLLGYDENGKGLTTKSEWNVTAGEDEAVTDISICHDPYYDLEGALIDLRRQGADEVCIRTIERVQEQLAAVSKRATAIRNRGETK